MPFKRLVLFIISVFVFCALRGTNWAQTALNQTTQSEFLSLSRFAPSFSLIPENDSIKPDVTHMKSSLLFSLHQDAFTLKTSVLEKQLNGQGPPDPFAAAPRKQQLLQTLATAAFLDGLLVPESELAIGSLDPKALGGFGKLQNRLLRFGVKGAWANLGYGAEYRSVGKAFTNLAGPQVATNQEGEELWVQQKFGALNLRGSLSQFTDNVEKDPLSPRITKSQGGATLSLALPSWPLLSLSYSRGFSSSSLEPAGFQPQKGPFETVGASIDYHAPAWDARLASSYELKNTGSLSSLSAGAYSVSPRVQTQTPSFSLGITYRLIPGALTLATGGYYIENKSSDGLSNNSALNASTSMVWDLGKSSLGNETLSLEAQQSRHLDAVTPGNSHNDMAVHLTFKIGFM